MQIELSQEELGNIFNLINIAPIKGGDSLIVAPLLQKLSLAAQGIQTGVQSEVVQPEEEPTEE